jgi:hypothetical protein
MRVIFRFSMTDVIRQLMGKLLSSLWIKRLCIGFEGSMQKTEKTA